MFNSDVLFDWFVRSTVGQLTTGTIPLAIWFLLTALGWLAALYIAMRWGHLKFVGKYIVYVFTGIATTCLFISVFSTAYAYRGTPINATAENVTLLDAGDYTISGVIEDPEVTAGRLFTVKPDKNTKGKFGHKTVYAANWQIIDQGIIEVGTRISILGYEKRMIFSKKVEIPDNPEGDEPSSQQLSMR